MRRPLLGLLVLGLLGPGAAAEVVVRAASNQVDIDASAVPLADVLDDLARQTGMEVVYEGPPPRQRVTLTLQGRSPAEAVQDVLEGQGLNYALIADPSGTRVQTLVITGAAGKGTSTGRSPAPRPNRPVIPPPAAGPDAMDEYDEYDEEDPFEDPALMEEEFPEEDPALDAPPPEAVPTAPVPAAGPMMFPGGQPRIYPASPFTPQPVFPGAAPAEGETETQPGQSPP